MLKFFGCAILFFFLSGCVTPITDVFRKGPSQWSEPDCRVILAACTGNNIHMNDTPVRVVAIPFTPLVLAAATKRSQLVKNKTKEFFADELTERLIDEMSVYFDAVSGRFFDAKGNYYRNEEQTDSLRALIYIQNLTWPCIAPLRNIIPEKKGEQRMARLGSGIPSDWPCYIPDITNLEEAVFLENEQGESVRAHYVWGRARNNLLKSELLLAMFPLRKDSTHFLAKTKKLGLLLKLERYDVRISIPLYDVPVDSKEEEVELHSAAGK